MSEGDRKGERNGGGMRGTERERKKRGRVTVTESDGEREK